MYYKIKVNKNDKNSLEIVGTVKRVKIGDGFLYCTKDEFDKLNPKAIKNYDIVALEEEKINEKKN